MKKIFVFAIIASFLTILTPFFLIKAESGDLIFSDPIKIADDVMWSGEYDIYGNKIVYINEDKDGGHKGFVYNINTKQNKQYYGGRESSMYENKIVYIDYDSSVHKWFIYLYDLDNNEETKLVEIYDANSPKPIIYKDKIVWKDKIGESRGIYLYDLSNGEKMKIADLNNELSPSSVLVTPVLFGNYISWIDEGDFYIYNINTKLKDKILNTHISKIENIDIYNNLIVGVGKDKNYNEQIYVYNIDTKQENKITDSWYTKKNAVSIYADKIVWTERRDWDTKKDKAVDDVFMYDLNTNKEYRITVGNEFNYLYPKIYENKIIYSDLNSNLYLAIFNDGSNDNKNNDEGKQIDPNLSKRLAGKLLLQVEDKGRIWYVNSDPNNKYEVTFANALPLFQKLSLGINNIDLYKIPIHPESVSDQNDKDNDGFSDKSEVVNGYNPDIPSDLNNRGNDKIQIDNNLSNRLKGKLLLQVGDKGRIWYVDFEGKRWEVTWNNLLDLFRKLSLGITNDDLGQIQTGTF